MSDSVYTRIEAVFRDHPDEWLTVRFLVEQVGCSPARAREAVQFLCDDGKVTGEKLDWRTMHYRAAR